ncbi:MAG: fatty acid--CoA ligase family protein, partial [Pseudomonadota bacterium]
AGTEAVVIFTSGSTGTPKAVSHSFRDFLNMAENYGNEVVELSARDRVIVTSKFCYSFGFSCSFISLLHGATLLLAEAKFNPDLLLKQIEDRHATVLFTFPTIYNILLKKRIRGLDSLRLCIAAGEAKSHFIDDRWERASGVPIHNGFGTTEALSFVFATPKSDPGGHNLGTVVPGFEVEIRRSNGEIAQIGEAGVAWIRGNTLATGYIGAPDKTAAAFKDGWYCTNDIIRMDEAQRFHYLGRATDVVKVGGLWMSPNDTQNLIAAHAKVKECAVVLYENPAPLVRPFAFVVPSDDAVAGPELAETIRDAVRAELGKAQVPYKVFFIDALPRTGNGKVQRNTLIDMVEGHMLAAQTAEG